ncbi:hypothetical protein [Nocardiopsis kunsanensis]|uniref:Uncharacterized protein n=1 Tax=Nocardiopsis kunsanensis TaxID=141693 RepID=A0A918XF72_9ACTN|nr:hypothetical protein [Nocardiopsis kunsanensis]GHD29411.1 hypothetical protein GCM10007147_30230 [Nocardiopsis kunsanensis]
MSTPSRAPRARASRTYVGWRPAVLIPHPGEAPRRPAPEDAGPPEGGRAGTEGNNEAHTDRPLHIALAGLGLLMLLCPLLWGLRILPGILALAGVFACATLAVPVAVALLQGRHVASERVRQARERLAVERDERERLLHERQRAHAEAYTAWQSASRAYEAQPHWYGVTVPEGVDSVIVAGGTDAGWSALLTTIGLSRLREGGDLTVVDLTGHGVSRELGRLARRCAVAPRHWVLPADLPSVTLGTDLDAGQRARILSAVAAAGSREEGVDADETLLLRLLEVLGPHAGVREIIGGLRALLTRADDDAEDDPALSLLSRDERDHVRARCGDDQDVWARAWELERRLAPFEAVGTRADDTAYAQVKIISVDRASGEEAARSYGTYAVAALSELLGDRPAGTAAPAPARRRTVVVCGAERLPAGEYEQVLSVAEGSGVEVVLLFRSPSEPVLARFEDPRCLPVVMRTEDDADLLARAVAEHPGGDPGRLAVHRLTETVGRQAEPETETETDEERLFPSPHTESGAVVRNAAAAVAPLDLLRRVSSATEWGRATARVRGVDAPPDGGSGDRSPVRTGGTDAAALRALPETLALVLDPSGPVLADTNPGILTLSTATLATVDDSWKSGQGTDAGHGTPGATAPPGPRTGGRGARTAPVTGPDDTGGRHGREREWYPAPVGADTGRFPERVPPNLGPPPERLDWRA